MPHLYKDCKSLVSAAKKKRLIMIAQMEEGDSKRAERI